MKNDTNKTAMQELISELKRVDDYPMIRFVIRTANDLLEKEKEQIIEAYLTGADYTNDEEVILANEYYNETYNK